MPAPLTIDDLTVTTPEGTGVFDVLMRAVKGHLEMQFKDGRIKGPEYATVYLGSANLAMQTGLAFLLQKDKQALEAELLASQIRLADVQVEIAQAELAISQAKLVNLPKEGALLDAQANKLNLEAANIPKQGALLDAQVLLAEKQVEIADSEIAIKEAQVEIAQAELAIAQAKLVNLPKEGALLDAQVAKVTADTTLINEQVTAATAKNFIHPTDPTLSGAVDQERQVMGAQVCKLKGEFDNIEKQTEKSTQEIALLLQKTATERAQTQAVGVDADSVVGKQKELYTAQTGGFTRDAEQKATKILVDTWNVRRTTDEATVANSTNMLDDVAVGRVVTRLLTGVGA